MNWQALAERQVRAHEAQRRRALAQIDTEAARDQARADVEAYRRHVLRVLTSVVRFGWWWPGED